MPDLLAYIAPDQLESVLGERPHTPGRRVAIHRGSLPEQLERLDELSSLFLITCDRGRAVVIASLDDPKPDVIVGDATLHDHDITDLLVRLGCDKVWRVSDWARVPRVVPPNDVDLLRYTLGLPLSPDRMPAPRSSSEPDALRTAVFANPAADTPRRAYATRLVELGDPRGELILLQLARTASGDAISDRERELVQLHGASCAEELRPYLATYDLQRGFVETAVVDRVTTLPPEIASAPSWATVRDLATVDASLLAAGHLVSCRTLRTTGDTLASLKGPVNAVEELLPYPDTGRGIVLPSMDVLDAFPRLRAISVDATAGNIDGLLDRSLAHVDAWIDIAQARAWRDAFDRSQLPLLSLRFDLHHIEPVVAFERSDGPHRMRVELRATVSSEIAHDVARVVAELARGVSHLDIVDTSLAPFAAQQPDLIAALSPAIPSIELRRGVSLALA